MTSEIQPEVRSGDFILYAGRDPARGYIKGNVAFLSRRANRLKNNTTISELKQLLDWMEKHENAKNIS